MIVCFKLWDPCSQFNFQGRVSGTHEGRNEIIYREVFYFFNLAEKLCECGRGREIRTPDLLVPNQLRYQAALCPELYYT